MFAKRRRRRPLAGLFFAGALPATGNPCILKRILEQKISAELSDIEIAGLGRTLSSGFSAGERDQTVQSCTRRPENVQFRPRLNNHEHGMKLLILQKCTKEGRISAQAQALNHRHKEIAGGMANSAASARAAIG
jgi:hypothetical protein